MKKMMFSLVTGMLLFTSLNSFAGNPGNDTTLTTQAIAVEEPFSIQEETAQFPGGEKALQQFIYQNMQYPVIAKTQGIEGKVIVALEVDETGAFTHIEVLQAVGGGCEEEVIRVLNSMPHWTPSMQAGHAIKAKRIFSFYFQL